MRKISTIKENIIQYLDYKGISKYRFYKDTGISNGVLDKESGMSEENIDKFLSYANDINPNWLLTGKGEMIRSKDSAVNEPLTAYSKANNINIPLLDIDAVAGFGNSSFSINQTDILEFYSIPEFQKVDFMIRITSDSMEPSYRGGDVVACRIIHERTFIQWNRAHLIATKSQGLIIKRVLPGKDDGQLKCVSDNQNYPPFDLPIEDELEGLALIIGTVRLE